jgi:hypothetical protein
VRCETVRDRVKVEIGPREGTYAPERAEVHVELRGLGDRPREVRVDGRVQDAVGWDGAVARIVITERGEATVVEVHLSP